LAAATENVAAPWTVVVVIAAPEAAWSCSVGYPSRKQGCAETFESWNVASIVPAAPWEPASLPASCEPTQRASGTTVVVVGGAVDVVVGGGAVVVVVAVASRV